MNTNMKMFPAYSYSICVLQSIEDVSVNLQQKSISENGNKKGYAYQASS